MGASPTDSDENGSSGVAPRSRRHWNSWVCTSVWPGNAEK